MGIGDGYSCTTGGSSNIMTHKKKGTRKERREEARARGRKRAGLAPRDKREDPKATARQFRDGKLIRIEGEKVGEEREEPTPTEERPTILLPKPKDDRGIVSKVFGDLPGFRELREEGRLKTGTLPLGLNIGAVGGIGRGVIAGGDTAVNQIIATIRSQQGGGILGTFKLNAINTGFNKALSAAKFKPTAARPATQTITKVGEMVINTKTIGLTKNILGKVFSIKAMGFAGAWASSVFLGRWGQAEAPEGIMIPIRDLIKLAETPEDWEIIEEHLQLAEELSNTETWEDIILWSPFSAVKGIMDKVRGVAAGVEILRETAEQIQKIQIKEQETGETEFARERRETDEEAIERKKAEEERQDIRFEGIEEERIARQEEEDRRAVIMQEVWRLRREGRFSEADELELTIIS